MAGALKIKVGTEWKKAGGGGGGGGGFALVATSYSGVDPTGTTNSHTGLTAWLTALSGSGKRGILPPGNYLVNTAYLGLPSNIDIWAYGAKLTRGGTGDQGVLYAENKSNITIRGLEIDGNKAAYATVTEQRHNINLYGVTNVTLEDVYSHHAKGDGLVWGGGSSILHGIRCQFNANHRQGMSGIWGWDTLWELCEFNDTIGTAPQCGVDLEPDLTTSPLYNNHFVRCNFNNNAGSGFLAAGRPGHTVEQASYTLIDCTIKNNAEANGGLVSSESDYAAVIRTIIQNNTGHGVYVMGNLKRFILDASHVLSNGNYGVHCRPFTGNVQKRVILRDSEVAASAGGIAVMLNIDGTLERIDIDGCVLNSSVRGLYLQDLAGTTGIVSVNGGSITAPTRVWAFDVLPTTFRARDVDGAVTRKAGTATIGDGGTIAHGLAVKPMWNADATPTRYGVTGSVAGQIVTVTSVNATNLTVAIKTGGGAAGSSQTVAWWAES